MTKPRALGNVAKEYITRAAEEIQSCGTVLQPIVEKQMTREELIVRVTRVMLTHQLVLRYLERVGAQTRPQ